MHVHSDACVILSYTAKSKIGRVRSGQAVVLSSPTESNQEGRRKLKQKKGKKGKSKGKPSAAKVLLWFKFTCGASGVFVCTNLLCRKQHAQIWFVFQLPRARDKFSLTALRRLGSGSEKDSLASMQSNYANTHICRASQCSHSGQEWSCSLTRSKYRCGTPGLKSCKEANSYIMLFQPPLSFKAVYKEICENFISLPRKKEACAWTCNKWTRLESSQS